jgi:hypothetical protein
MLAQGGYKRLDAVLKRLPRSTEEILHPEQYERDQPDFEVIKPDKLRRAVQSVYPTLSFGDPVYTDVLGEAGISALGAVLPLGKESQEPLGAGWGGDLVGLFEERQRSAVVWITSWDTQAAAQRFEREMRRALEDRCKIKNAPFCQINFERDGKTLTLVVSDRSRRSSTQNVPGPVPEKSDDSASHP